MSTLEQERKYFEAHREEWSKIHPGKFVLVKGEQLVGAFDDAESAVDEGIKQFGTESFLVRKVCDNEDSVYIPALALGLI